ncbi:RNA 2',3'-cyclic phosphodiesterase [Chloroflexota bacterium]
MEQIRSFIAIELPGELKQKLGQLEAHLKAGGLDGVRWVKPDSIHLTLKFLGNVAIDRTGEIAGAMEEAARGIPPFALEVKDLGIFPNPKRVQVAWVGLSGEVDRLELLQQQLESSLERLGFAPESRSFTPHLTIARVSNRATPDERQKFGRLIADARFDANAIRVDAISLIRSQLTREGAIYSRISLVKL